MSHVTSPEDGPAGGCDACLSFASAHPRLTEANTRVEAFDQTALAFQLFKLQPAVLVPVLICMLWSESQYCVWLKSWNKDR